MDSIVQKLYGTRFENPCVDWSPHNMALNVFITEHSERINLFNNPGEIIEARIKLAQGVGT